jgi:predicted N-formylglutamate amidohydrolase
MSDASVAMSDALMDARARHGLARGRDVRVLITCEHGGNEVPEEYATLFEGLHAELSSHRGWDAGALGLAEWLGTELRAPVIASRVSRLLVDLNRSEHHPRVFSEATRLLARPDRERLLARYHRPHRTAVADAVARLVRRRCAVLHLAIHSFTPVLDGVVRSADLGVLYDPARGGERALCVEWAHALSAGLPGRSVRRNYPYRGRSDGLTTTLRGLYGREDYLGIEIEVSQKHVGAGARFPDCVGEALAGSLRAVLGGAGT